MTFRAKPSWNTTLIGIGAADLGSHASDHALHEHAGARSEALRESARQEEGEPVFEALPSVNGTRWAVLTLIGALVATVFAAACLCRIEVTTVASGALIVEGGPRPVLALAPGRVLQLKAKAGDRVEAGAQLAAIDVTELRARERHSSETLTAQRQENQRATADNTQLYDATVVALKQKRAVLQQRLALKAAALRERREHTQNMQELAREGAASQNDAFASREALRSSQEELLALQQQIAEVDLELEDRKKSFLQDLESRKRMLDEAESSLYEARSLVDLSDVRAPVTGRVESLLVREGEVVSPDAPIARIVPEGALNTLVVFAPARDAAFLHRDLRADVEFSSLSVSEYGKFRSRVTRVSNDVATPGEMSAVLGASAEGAVVRVELELVPGPNLDRVRARLRSGERVVARLNTRERPIIALVFDFLRKWYPT
jgi:multidrug resistance efflux pump